MREQKHEVDACNTWTTRCRCLWRSVEALLASDPTRCDDNVDDQVCLYHDWVRGAGLYANLSFVYVINLLFTIGAVTLSFSCGIFSPVFTLLGAGPHLRRGVSGWLARMYSVVGAAAM